MVTRIGIRGTQFSLSDRFQMPLDCELLSGIYTECAVTTSSKIPSLLR